MQHNIFEKTKRFIVFTLTVALITGGAIIYLRKDKTCRCIKPTRSKEIHLKEASLYKIVSPKDFVGTNEKNCIKTSQLDQESQFMHAAYGKQVKNIVNKFFKNEKILFLLELDLDELKKNGITLKPEANKPGGEIFPHLYGFDPPKGAIKPIPITTVKNIVVFKA